MHRRLAIFLLCLFCGWSAMAAVTPDMQKAIRAATFEVVRKKPEHDPLEYEKPLPFELLPYSERTDAYQSIGTAFALGNNTYVTAAHVLKASINSQYGPPALRASNGTVSSKILPLESASVIISVARSSRPMRRGGFPSGRSHGRDGKCGR